MINVVVHMMRYRGIDYYVKEKVSGILGYNQDSRFSFSLLLGL